MNQTSYAWYVIAILVISGIILFVLDAKFARSEDRQKEQAIVRSFGLVHLGISAIGLATLVIYWLIP